jgi:hypothetical protein
MKTDFRPAIRRALNAPAKCLSNLAPARRGSRRVLVQIKKGDNFAVNLLLWECRKSRAESADWVLRRQRTHQINLLTQLDVDSLARRSFSAEVRQAIKKEVGYVEAAGR